MEIRTRRKIYYTSVILALVAILVCAVIINRTLVNTPKMETDAISTEAGEPIEAYMAYVDGDGVVITGIAEEGDEDTADIIALVKNSSFDSLYSGDSTSSGSVPDAWVVLYDNQNRIASRMNFYDGGASVWFDGMKYDSDPALMQTIIDYCNVNIRDEEKSVTETDTSEEQIEAQGE